MKTGLICKNHRKGKGGKEEGEGRGGGKEGEWERERRIEGRRGEDKRVWK